MGKNEKLMKVKLSEKTLNLYINQAILQEIRDWGVPNYYEQNRQNNSYSSPSSSFQSRAYYEEKPEKSQVIPEEAPFLNDAFKVSQFQVWYNKNMKGNLVIDGIWGPKTKAAWTKWAQAQQV